MVDKDEKPFVLHGVQVVSEESLKKAKAVALVLFDVVGAEFCSKRLRAFQAILPKLEKAGVQVYGITVNKDLAATACWAEKIGVEFPLLLDVDGAVSRKYGLLDQKAGRSERALVILRNGAVSHREIVTKTDVPAEVLRLIG
jgi:peroxiredoxin